MTADLLARKETSFVLWHVGNTTPVPSLIVGQVKPGAPLTFIDKQEFPLTQFLVSQTFGKFQQQNATLKMVKFIITGLKLPSVIPILIELVSVCGLLTPLHTW